MGGEEPQAIELLDVDRKKILPDRLSRGLFAGLVFSPDGRGFYYSHTPIDNMRPDYRAVRWHTLGTGTEEDFETFFIGENPRLHLTLLRSPDGSQMVLYGVLCGDPQTTDLYIQNLASSGQPKLVVERCEGHFYGFLSGNQLIAFTDCRSPKGRIVAIDLDRPQPGNWVDVVPESDLCMRGVAVSDERIFVGYIENAVTSIKIFDRSGRDVGAIPCPPHGTATLLQADANSDAVFYSFTSFSEPPSTYCYHAKSARQELWANHHVPFDGSSIEVDQVRYTSKDGTQIPMFLVCQKGRRGQPMPTFLTGYGGFGTSITPRFTAYATFLMEQGFLFAVANLRGGSEFGEEWHLAGKRHNRQNAFDDFVAAAEWLVAEGHADPGRIAIGGGSNAGLLVGAALTQRPDLFRAVV